MKSSTAQKTQLNGKQEKHHIEVFQTGERTDAQWHMQVF